MTVRNYFAKANLKIEIQYKNNNLDFKKMINEKWPSTQYERNTMQHNRRANKHEILKYWYNNKGGIGGVASARPLQIHRRTRIGGGVACDVTRAARAHGGRAGVGARRATHASGATGLLPRRRRRQGRAFRHIQQPRDEPLLYQPAHGTSCRQSTMWSHWPHFAKWPTITLRQAKHR